MIANAPISGTPPPDLGVWVINNETSLSYEDLIIKGNITINGSGKLTLFECNLTINCTDNGEFTISVNNSGELIIINSTIKSYNSSYNYKFKVYGNLTLVNSSVDNLWGANENPVRGIQIYSSDNITISSNSITNPNGSAIYFKDCQPSIYNKYKYYLNPLGSDSDDDGLTDYLEIVDWNNTIIWEATFDVVKGLYKERSNPENNDTYSDGVGDNLDAFPENPAASVDSDGDRYPDRWNPGKTKDNSTTGLELDYYPDDPNRYEREFVNFEILLFFL